MDVKQEDNSQGSALAVQQAPTQAELAQREFSLAQSVRVEDTVTMMNALEEVHQRILKRGSDYDTIKGCGDKPTLLKPGAEKLLKAFGLGVTTIEVREEPTGTDEQKRDGHLKFDVRTSITHLASGVLVGVGVGKASTLEDKYRRQKAYKDSLTKEELERSTPIIYKGNADQYKVWVPTRPDDKLNTVIKMAKKRSMIDGVLTAVAASHMFTMDIEDDPGQYQRDSGSSQRQSRPQQSAPAQQSQQQQAPPKLPLGAPIEVMVGNGRIQETSNGPAYVWAAGWKDDTGAQHNAVLWCWHENEPKAATDRPDPENYSGYVTVTLRQKPELSPEHYAVDKMELGLGPAIDMDTRPGTG